MWIKRGLRLYFKERNKKGKETRRKGYTYDIRMQVEMDRFGHAEWLVEGWYSRKRIGRKKNTAKGLY
jgi:hypothetical protein